MASAGTTVLGLTGGIRAAWTDTQAGDLRPSAVGPGPLVDLSVAVAGDGGERRVHWAEQVHGRTVHVVGGPDPGRGDPGPSTVARGASVGPGDALVSSDPGSALCVLVADCAPLALASPEGVFAAVHAGWRGLLAGVVDGAVEAMRRLGATSVVGALGPCIRPCCYEFGADELGSAVEALGPGVVGRTRTGRPALDLPAATAAALTRSGGALAAEIVRCTGCGGGSFSHRARADVGRQAVVVWRDRPGPRTTR